jgi:hypothetical protein
MILVLRPLIIVLGCALALTAASSAATTAGGFKNPALVARKWAAWQNSNLTPGLLVLQPARCFVASPSVIRCDRRMKFTPDLGGEVLFEQQRIRRLDSTRARWTVLTQGNKGFINSNTSIVRSRRLGLRSW